MCTHGDDVILLEDGRALQCQFYLRRPSDLLATALCYPPVDGGCIFLEAARCKSAGIYVMAAILTI